jgi:hypothetical protein
MVQLDFEIVFFTVLFFMLVLIVAGIHIFIQEYYLNKHIIDKNMYLFELLSKSK